MTVQQVVKSAPEVEGSRLIDNAISLRVIFNLVVVFILALAALVGLAVAYDPGIQAQPPVVVGIDVSPLNGSGNGTSLPRHTAESGAQCLNNTDDDFADDTQGGEAQGVINDGCGLGPIDQCIQVSSGSSFRVDIFLNAIPDGTDLGGFSGFLNFDTTKLDYLGPDGDNFSHKFLIVRDPESGFLVNTAVDQGATNQRINITVADVNGAASAEQPGEFGVLGRYNFSVVGGSGTLTLLTLSGVGTLPAGSFKVTNNGGIEFAKDQVWDSDFSPQYGIVAIDTACPPPTGTPSPTTSPTPSPTTSPTPSPTTSPTPSPTPTPPAGTVYLAAGWNHSCYQGLGQPIADAFAGVAGVTAVYRMQNQSFDRWFPDRPELSTIDTLSSFDSLLVLAADGGAWTVTPNSDLPTSAALSSGWNSICYLGAGKDTGEAAAGIAGEYAVTYTFADQSWRRYVLGRPELSNLLRLETSTPVVILVTDPEGALWVFDP